MGPGHEVVAPADRVQGPGVHPPVLVHADFKPGNILLDGDRITALLDWELAHLGDPLEDLGWVTQPLRTLAASVVQFSKFNET